MAPVLEVDIDALNADGRRLESPGHPFKQSNCAPPGSDSMSLGAATALNAHEMALIDLLEYATRVREYGGAVIKSAAVVFELAEQAGAASIHRSTTPMRRRSRRRVRYRCRYCHRYLVSRRSRAFPSCLHCHRSEASSSPPTCTQARVRLICGTFRALGTTTAKTSPTPPMTPARWV